MNLKQIRESINSTSVIFIHGILSKDEEGWKNKNGTNWPGLLEAEEEFQETGIYVFSYKTGFLSRSFDIIDIVSNLWELMKAQKVLYNNQKLIFVCHSMGGIVARKLLVRFQWQLHQVINYIGLFLVASPSMGSDYADFFSILIKLAGHAQAEKLRENNPWLKELDNDFINLKEDDNPPFVLKGKELMEDKAYFKGNKIVGEFSATRYFKERLKIDDSSHSSIAKPENRESIQHQSLCLFIRNTPSSFDLVSSKVAKNIKLHLIKYVALFSQKYLDAPDYNPDDSYDYNVESFISCTGYRKEKNAVLLEESENNPDNVKKLIETIIKVNKEHEKRQIPSHVLQTTILGEYEAGKWKELKSIAGISLPIEVGKIDKDECRLIVLMGFADRVERSIYDVLDILNNKVPEENPQGIIVLDVKLPENKEYSNGKPC